MSYAHFTEQGYSVLKLSNSDPYCIIRSKFYKIDINLKLMPKVYKLNLVCPCRRINPDSIPKLDGIGHFHRLVQNWTVLIDNLIKFTINCRKIIRTRSIYSRFRIELNFPGIWKYSDFDQF